MYHHPGEYVTDFCIVKRGDAFHLFHIRGERWTWPLGYRELDLGHAVSTDLRRWTPHEPVLPAGPQGAWDERGNWAPHIVEHQGVYYCFYTGSDRNNNQAIGLATSSDLFEWTKYPENPVVRPGAWSDREVGANVAGRDAMVFHDRHRDMFLLYYTATMADGRACIALSQSQDLIHWHDLGPTYIEDDRTYNRLESAYLVPHGEQYYLFYSAKGGPNSKGYAPSDFAHFDIVYQISSDPCGPWRRPANHELLTEWSCASEHPTFDGVTYMFYVIQEEIDGVWGASVLSDPKRIEWMDDGTVEVREWLPENVERRLLFSSQEDRFWDWIQHGGAWSGQQDGVLDAPGPDAAIMDTLWGKDLDIEVEVWLEAGQTASLLVRANPSALAGYRVSLEADGSAVTLSRLTPGRSATILQARMVALELGRWHKLKVVVQDEFIDIYVDGVLQIVRHERTYRDGCFGLHAAGPVRFRNCLATHHAGPETAVADWHSRCTPRHLMRQLD